MNDIRDPETYAIIGAAMSVHRILGYGFLEAVYQEALEKEFTISNIPFQREVKIPILYRCEPLKVFYKADFLCYDSIILELKATEKLTPEHESQIINYLKGMGLKRGLLLNFGSPTLEYKRFIREKMG